MADKHCKRPVDDDDDSQVIAKPEPADLGPVDGGTTSTIEGLGSIITSWLP